MIRLIALAAGLLVAAGAGMASDPVCPGPLSTVDVNNHGLINDAAAVDDLVVTFDQRGITTWSIVDPERPTELGHYAVDRERLGRTPYDSRYPATVDLMLDLEGDWACIVPYFECFDLSDPTRPAPQQWGIEDWPCDDSHYNCRPSRDFALSRKTMAVIEDAREIWLLELDENRPSRWIRPQGWADRFGDIASVAFADHVLLVLEYDKTLTAWDLQDPEQPVQVGSGTLDSVRFSVEGWRLRPHQRGVIAFGGNSQGWQELAGISTLNLPQLPSAELTHELDWDPVEELEFVGDRGVALMRTWDSDAREWVYNFSEIRAPSAFAMYVRSTVDTEETDFSMTSSHVIGWPGSAHLEVFRLGDQLTLEGATPRVGEVLDLDVEGDIGILANGAEGITVLDLGNPEDPLILSTLRIPNESVERVRLQGSTAFLLTEGSLASVDLMNPAEPRLIKHRYIDGVCCHLELTGGVAVVGSRDDCTMPLINIADPTRLLRISDADFCHPGYMETIRKLQVVNETAYVQTNWYFYGVDISDPLHPVKIVDHYDRDYQSFHAEDDYLLMTYHDEMRLCQVTAGGNVNVGRVYEDLSAYGLDALRRDLVLGYAHERQTVIDFGDLIQPRSFAVRMTDNGLPAGETIGHVWLRPFRNMIDVMSLECRPPEASFRRRGHDLEIWFEDTSRYRVDERRWDFGDGATSTDVAPIHTFAEAGRYRVTLTVSNENGTDTVERNIHLGDALHGDGPAHSTVD
jgi:hypothetical protein